MPNSEDAAQTSASGLAQIPTSGPKDKRDSSGSREAFDTFDNQGAILTFVGLVAATVTGGLSFLLFGIAMGTHTQGLAGVAVCWFILALGMLVFLPAVFRRESFATYQLFAAWAWAIFFTALHGRAFGAGWWYLSNHTPPLMEACGISLALIAAYLIGAGWRILTKNSIHESDSPAAHPPRANSSNFSFLLSGVFLIGLVLVPVFGVESFLHARAQRVTTDLNKRFAPQPDAKLVLGGMSFLPEARHGTEAQQKQLESCMAALEALRDTGSTMACFKVNGDCFLPMADPLLIQNELAVMKKARALGMKVVLTDVPSPFFTRNPISWERFQAEHRMRILNYAAKVRPEVYSICTGMLDYHRLGNISTRFDRRKPRHVRRAPLDDFLDMWKAHLVSVAQAVKEASPETKIAITIEPWTPEDASIYFLMLREEVIDIVGIQAYGPEQLESCARMLKQGPGWSPAFHKKRLWIMGSFFGYPLSLPRDEAIDAAWLTSMVGWAQRSNAEALLLDSGGMLIPNGDRLAQKEDQLAALRQQAAGHLSEVGSEWKRLAELFGTTKWQEFPVEPKDFDLKDKASANKEESKTTLNSSPPKNRTLK